MQTTTDPTDFTEVYVAHYPTAVALARRLTRDDAVAEDVATEALLKVWRHWDDGVVERPWPYLRRTVLNEVIDRSRRAQREQAATARQLAWLPPAEPDPEADIDDRELVARLLDRLPPQQRRILELRFLEDLGERQTAMRLGISVGAVKSGTSRGLARLRADLDDRPELLAAA